MMSKNSVGPLKHFDRIFLKGVPPPPCSRLYSLEPIGVGTPMVESLTSYVIRLAAAHCVKVGRLVAEEILPVIDKGCLVSGSSRPPSRERYYAARVMNGYGTIATDWVTAMQALTCRQELCFMTMLHWKVLVANKLLRKVRAWCPECYEKWHQAGTPIYDPLMWSLEVVTTCPTHNRFLRDKCVHCGKHLSVLLHNVQPGFCSSCNRWLGVSRNDVLAKDEVLHDSELKWQTWLVHHLGALLADAPKSHTPPRKEVVADIVDVCVQRFARGNINTFFYRFKSFNHVTISQWRQGLSRPQLGRLADLCYAADIPMSDVLTGRLDINSLLKEYAPIRDKNSFNVTAAELKNIEAALHSIIREDPPPSVNDISTRLGRHYNTVKFHFPTLFQQVKERYVNYREAKFDKEKVLLELLSAEEECPPPSLNSLAKRLDCSAGFLRLHFSEHCRIIAIRHAEFRRGFADPDEIRIKLQAFLTEFPPKPITQCLEQLGCTRPVLSRHFPEASHAIGVRYKNYRQNESRKRKEKLLKAVLAVAAIIEKENLPLNSYQIIKRLPHLKRLTNYEVIAALHQMERLPPDSLP